MTTAYLVNFICSSSVMAVFILITAVSERGCFPLSVARAVKMNSGKSSVNFLASFNIPLGSSVKIPCSLPLTIEYFKIPLAPVSESTACKIVTTLDTGALKLTYKKKINGDKPQR